MGMDTWEIRVTTFGTNNWGRVDDQLAKIFKLLNRCCVDAHNLVVLIV